MLSHYLVHLQAEVCEWHGWMHHQQHLEQWAQLLQRQQNSGTDFYGPDVRGLLAYLSGIEPPAKMPRKIALAEELCSTNDGEESLQSMVDNEIEPMKV